MNIDFYEKYNMFPSDGIVLCAVSGGKDSMYLLFRLRGLASEYGFEICCAHFNHCLRGDESDRDQKFVEDICKSLGIPCHVGSGDVALFAKEKCLSIEEAARTLRYEFLENTADRIGAKRIATAHTADDNIETILFNLARGTGLKGLCGIPPVRGRIIRPMLQITTDEVLSYLKENNIPHVEDSTNLQDEYTRNRIRHRIVPELKNINDGFSENIIRSISNLRDDEAYLSAIAQSFVNENFKGNTVSASTFSALPKSMSSRVLQLIAPRSLSAAHIEAVIKIAEGKTSHAFADIPGLRVCRDYDKLIFGDEPELDIEKRELIVGGTTKIPEAGLEIFCEFIKDCREIHNSVNIFYFKSDTLCDKIFVKSRSDGDNIRLSGRKCTKTLKKLFSENKLNGSRRDLIPVLHDSKGVIAVYGFGIAERCCPNLGDDVLRAEIRPLHTDD